jgi:hypothetical protein
VLIGAVLGSYFLKEVLGTLGKLGCAICLIGSVMIVLHAPPDKDIQTIDEILHFAIQPGKHLTSFSSPPTNDVTRLSAILPRCSRICGNHDLSSRTEIREEEPAGLHFDLLDSWSGICDVSQGFRYRPQAYPRWEQSVYSPVDLCLHNFDYSLHFDTDELSQQSFEPIPDVNVSLLPVQSTLC